MILEFTIRCDCRRIYPLYIRFVTVNAATITDLHAPLSLSRGTSVDIRYKNGSLYMCFAHSLCCIFHSLLTWPDVLIVRHPTRHVPQRFALCKRHFGFSLAWQSTTYRNVRLNLGCAKKRVVTNETCNAIKCNKTTYSRRFCKQSGISIAPFPNVIIGTC